MVGVLCLNMVRKIIHVDMDCFYAAVEMRDQPELRGKPLGVGGSVEGRGVIAAASYEARRYGVHSAMPTAQALKLCPQLVLVSPDFRRYKAESQKIHEIFRQFTSLIEPLSLDEAFLDVSDCEQFDGIASRTAYEIRRLIYEELQLTASAGIAPNKFLAKIASDWNKPNGQKTVAPQQVNEFIREVPVGKIFGVGKVTEKKMEQLGLKTCADLQKLSQYELVRQFGSWGLRLYDLCRGKDNRAVNVSRERKSLSVENTFERDLATMEEASGEIESLYEDFSGRWRRSDLPETRIKTLFVKLKYHDFKQITRERGAHNLPTKDEFYRLIHQAWSEDERPVRLIGIGVRLLTDQEAEGIEAQIPLF